MKMQNLNPSKRGDFGRRWPCRFRPMTSTSSSFATCWRVVSACFFFLLLRSSVRALAPRPLPRLPRGPEVVGSRPRGCGGAATTLLVFWAVVFFFSLGPPLTCCSLRKASLIRRSRSRQSQSFQKRYAAARVRFASPVPSKGRSFFFVDGCGKRVLGEGGIGEMMFPSYHFCDR